MTQDSSTASPPSGMSAEADAIHCIYFYYLHFPQGANRPDVRSIYEQFDIDDPIDDTTELVERVKALAVNAIENGKNPPRYAESIKDLNMDRRSHFVVVVDSPDKKVAQSGAIKFEGKNHKGKDTDGTHTFNNEVPLEFQVTLSDQSTRELTGICYTNIMFGKKDDGGSEKLKKGEWEDFKIDLKFRTVELINFQDSGGTNMGPPVPPPARLHGKGRDGKKS